MFAEFTLVYFCHIFVVLELYFKIEICRIDKIQNRPFLSQPNRSHLDCVKGTNV